MANETLKPLFPGEQPYRGKTVNPTQFARIGYISRVDYETGYVDIIWLEDQGYSPLVRLPLVHGSFRSCIRGMPEEGSIVICSWSRQTHTWEEPVIVGFSDLDLTHLLNYRLLRNSKTPNALTEIKTMREKMGYGSVRGKRRKIYPGEIQIESSPGAELYLDEDVYLSDSKLNEIEIRSADKSIRMSSNQLYTLTQASRSWNGLITREPGDLAFAFQPTVLPNGQKIQFVTDNGQPIHIGGKAFTEHRTELYETSDGIMRASEVNAGYDVNPLQPYLTFVMGTLVGNDKTNTSKYTKVLRPQVFGTATATEVSLDYLECTPEEYSKLASTLSFKHVSRAQIDIDKEGHLFTFFPASSGTHPLGSGRSWEGAFDGSIKLVIGSENINNESLVLDTKGGIKASLGYDKDGKSSYIIANKGVHLEVMSPAKDGIAYYLKTKGQHSTYIDGGCDMEVTGDYKVVVHGKYQVQSLGTKEENYVNDKNNMYGGSYKKIVIKDKQEQIGNNRIVKITGSLETTPGVSIPATTAQVVDQLEITTGSRDEKYDNGNLTKELLLGNIESTLTKGDVKSTITLGNIKETITSGNRETDLTSGNDVTKITTGNDTTEITTGNQTTTVKTGDITREVTTKSSVGISDKVTSGDHQVTVVTGNIKQNITTGDSTEVIGTGNKSITITNGKFNVNITSGDISIVTSRGAIKFDSTAQTVDINGQLTVTIKSGVKLNLSAPLVAIGQSAVMGNVLTGLPGIPSCFDPITGSPFTGSQTVTASN